MSDGKKEKKTALVTGSFDPITLGHINVVERASRVFDGVTVLIAINPDKEYMFTPEEKIAIAKAATAHVPNARVAFTDGLTVDYAKKVGACALVRGVRGAKNLPYEERLAEANKKLSPQIETVILPAEKKLSRISSTRVRELIKSGKSAEALVGAAAWDAIEKILRKRRTGKNG